MTYRGKLRVGCAILVLSMSFVTCGWGNTPTTPAYDPNSDLPPYESGPQTGTWSAQLSTNGPPVMTATPVRRSTVDDPNGRMIESLQRENGTGYYPSTTAPTTPPTAPKSLFPNDLNVPKPPQSTTIGKASYDEPLPGGTTHVLPADGMLSPDGQPVGAAQYQTQSYTGNPMAVDSPFGFNDAWTWQVLPGSILYKSYLASNHESRMGIQMVNIKNQGNFWDATLGGRVGILRYGNSDPYEPQGYQLDMEGAAFPRLNLDRDRDLDTVDFRFGIPLTMRKGPWQTKFGYYHLSSHMGDEFLVRNNTLDRLNYVRESLMLGLGVFLNPNFRLYSEVDYAFYVDGGAKPWEFQFGAEFSPIDAPRYRGSPFLAVHGHLHQEVDFGGSVTAQIGWQWRGRTGHLLRTGFQYFNGMSDQAQFYNRFEEQYGWGVWYDF